MSNPDFNCPILLAPMENPVTTPCGHTFEATALIETLEITPRCPLCRRPLNPNMHFPTNTTLRDAIRRELAAPAAATTIPAPRSVVAAPAAPRPIMVQPPAQADLLFETLVKLIEILILMLEMFNEVVVEPRRAAARARPRA